MTPAELFESVFPGRTGGYLDDPHGPVNNNRRDRALVALARAGSYRASVIRPGLAFIPAGYERIITGVTRIGDLCWNDCPRPGFPHDPFSRAPALADVGYFYCIIRKIPTERGV